MCRPTVSRLLPTDIPLSSSATNRSFDLAAGPPPGGPVEDTKHFSAHTHEDAAWNQALSESERRELDQHNENERAAGRAPQRYGNANDEEDEAWEEARRSGPTAHFTAGTANPWGAGGRNNRLRDDDDEGGRI
jgi:hypothetical protein